MAIPDERRHRAGVAATIMAAIVTALGVLVLGGWILGIHSLTTLMPDTASMKPNTALCFLLSGLSLWLGTSPSPFSPRRAEFAGRALALIPGLLGLLTLGEYLLGIDLHIDQLVRPDGLTSPDTLPGRMTGGTAFCFILFSVNRWILGTGRRPAERFFVVSLFLGLVFSYLTLTAYAYQTPILSRPAPTASMAVQTAFAFLLAFCGLIARRPDLGWAALLSSSGAGGALFRWLSPVVVFLPLAIGLLRVQGEVAGYYDMRAGVLLFTCANVLLLFLMLTFAAWRAERVDAERRASLASFNASEAIYRTTFDLAPVGIVHLAPDGRILMVNGFFCTLVGYRPDELSALDIYAITHPDDLAETRRGVGRIGAIPPPESATYAKRYVRKDGGTVWCEVTFNIHFDETGKADRSIAIVQDITARRQSEEAQRHLAAQLQQAQKMEAIGQLTGGMAHDFNNLLGVVVGNLDFLRDMFPPDSDGGQLTRDAITAATQGSELIRRMLAFARRQPLIPKLTDLAAIIEGAGELLRRSLGREITLRVKLADGLWPVMIDVAQLESAIVNLAVNSRHAMPHGGLLMIEARNVSLDENVGESHPEAVPGDYLAISVSDTGTGMSPEILARVFEPFFTTKGVEGSGLGLSMVHGFVRQSGGHTRIYSEEGRGTTVRIFLPRATAEEPATTAETETTPLTTGREAILVVDDNQALLRVTLKQLQSLGYRTIAANDAFEAMTLIREGTAFDLLFTDIVMPGGMDGRELAAAARKLRPTLPVLFTSGFTADVATAAMTEDFSGNLLSKPYRKEDLAQRIRAALDNRA